MSGRRAAFDFDIIVDDPTHRLQSSYFGRSPASNPHIHIHTMPVKQLDTPYPVIDADPHFSRVVRSFRSSDYAAMAGATAAFPSAIYMMEMFDPTRPKRGLGSALRLSTFLGLCGGFLFAYQRTSFRFWGWKENELEQQAHQAALDAGIKPPGTDPSKSDLTPYMQGVAHRNSAFSQLKFSTLPWFNLVDHPYHGGNNSQESS